MKKYIIPIIGVLIILGFVFFKTTGDKLMNEKKLHKEKIEHNEKYNQCQNEYDRLEQRFYKAKHWYNDDENEIVRVKEDLRRLRHECSQFPDILSDINKLIDKCNDELD